MMSHHIKAGDLLQYGPENLLDTGDVLVGEGEEHFERRARSNSRRTSSFSKPISLPQGPGRHGLVPLNLL
jgi:hypothetical protein